jgi:FtsP/CotA-like multicopper oxidase with cupredoxin domain
VSSHDHHAPDATSSVTRPQLFVVGLLSMLVLVVGVLIPANRVNLGLSAEDTGEVIMPKGMVMGPDTPGEAMEHMGAVDPGDIGYRGSPEEQGNRPLEPRIDDDGTKVFDLTVSVIQWHILEDEPVAAYAFNDQVPGPLIRVRQGDHVVLNVHNELPETTTVHWHGLDVPNEMDGPAFITQDPIEPGESYRYEFTVDQVGTFMYHSHDQPDRQQALGMYGALIVDPADPSVDEAYGYQHDIPILLQEWLEREGYTYPAMLMEGGMPNFFTINGKAFPATQTVHMKVGERARIRFIGTHNNFVHPMHIHGGPFRIIQTDGNPVPVSAQLLKDTVNVGPGERYDVIWEALRPGKWLLHCHIPHHTTNDNVEEQGAGGLTVILDVSE